MNEYFKVKNKLIVIEFDKIFCDPELEKYNYFRLTYNSKRFYSDNIDIFVRGCNAVLNKDPKAAMNILYQYLNLKKAIDDKKIPKYKTFISLLISNLFTYQPKNGQKNIIEVIKDYVDEKYVDHIDPFYEENVAKYEQPIMFFERHYKILFMLTSLSQFVIPLALHYISNNPSVGMDADSFVYLIIMELMELISVDSNGEKINIYTKLYRHAQKHMQKTDKTDKQGMVRLQFYGVTPESTVENVMKKLITNILPKYDFEKDIMKFNQTVIRTSIDIYTLRKHDPIPARCIINDGEGFGDEEDNGMELFNTYNKSKNEKTVVLRRTLADKTMDSIARKYNIVYTKAEYDWYLKNLEINPLQVTLVSQILATDFGGSENIAGCNRASFIKGIIIVHKRMLSLNLVHLANYIIAKRTTTVLNTCQVRTLIKKIQSHPIYQKIIENRYKSIRTLSIEKITNKTDKTHPIINIMKLILNENYIFCGYNDPDNGKPIEKNKDLEDIILNEVLNIYQLLIQ